MKKMMHTMRNALVWYPGTFTKEHSANAEALLAKGLSTQSSI